MIKKAMVLLLTLTFMLTLSGLAWGSEISVEVNGVAVSFGDAVPFVDENGRTMTPLRPIADALSMTVTWDSATQQATFVKAYALDNTRLTDSTNGYLVRDTVVFTIGSATASHTTLWQSGHTHTETITMDTAAILQNGSTYAPVRYLALAVGYEVDWNASRRAVLVYTARTTPPEPIVAAPPTGSSLSLSDLGRTYETYWFDFTVKQVVVTNSYHGYDLGDDYLFYCFLISETNTFGSTLPMFSSDFCLRSSHFNGYEYPLYNLNEYMMPDSFELAPGQTVEYWVIFLLPTSITDDLQLVYIEVAEGNMIGATHVFSVL